eukprot:GEZU01002979.1.p1 GENE.GEZU01002979.1~~GEZU01002979.1.p1  ORF type:complete len:109 (-),score=35.16 GEZU01002979.1:2-328(-)
MLLLLLFLVIVVVGVITAILFFWVRAIIIVGVAAIAIASVEEESVVEHFTEVFEWGQVVLLQQACVMRVEVLFFHKQRELELCKDLKFQIKNLFLADAEAVFQRLLFD